MSRASLPRLCLLTRSWETHQGFGPRGLQPNADPSGFRAESSKLSWGVPSEAGRAPHFLSRPPLKRQNPHLPSCAPAGFWNRSGFRGTRHRSPPSSPEAGGGVLVWGWVDHKAGGGSGPRRAELFPHKSFSQLARRSRQSCRVGHPQPVWSASPSHSASAPAPANVPGGTSDG